MINAARRTPAKIKYRMNGADAMAYVEKVDVGTRSFYVGSSLYTYDNIETIGINESDATPVENSKNKSRRERMKNKRNNNQ